jgi:DNA polymerase (family 10)
VSRRLKAEELHQARSTPGITCGDPGVVDIREAKLGSPSAGPAARHNEAITARLRQAARLLEQQKANPFRVRAFRRAADTIDRLPEDVGELVARGGPEALRGLPGIGPGIAAAVHEILATGRWGMLERLRGTLDPEHLLRSVPGVGRVLAGRIHDALQVDSLEALESAAHDGRLASVPGMGARRVAMIRCSLAGMLGRRRLAAPTAEPPVSMLLDVDEEYRGKAAAGRLVRIAPHRFNPSGRRWLPVLHTERGPWHFTALFSNTARAHELGRTRDWVVVYFHADHEVEGQHTIVTETHGPLAGRRVVRGRESECPVHGGERASESEH